MCSTCQDRWRLRFGIRAPPWLALPTLPKGQCRRSPKLEPVDNIWVLPYRIEYSPAAVEHLRTLGAGRQRTVRDSVDEQLRNQPGLETRNRKPMRPNPVAPWELR